MKLKLMTLTRRRNLHSGLHICGQYTISCRTVFLSDGAFMEDCLVRYVAPTLIVSILLLVGRSATLIVIDVGYHQNSPLECRRIALGKALPSRRDYQNV
jgi:hypothetical protein